MLFEIQNPLLILGFVLSFFSVLFGIPFWISKMKERSFLWEDMNIFKDKRKENIAGAGGIIVVMGFLLGVLYYIAVRNFLFNQTNGINVQIFALLNVILILGIIGLVDDFFGWKSGGLSNRFRIIAVLFASIPLIVINAGVSSIGIPFFGKINFGIFYPLVLVPLGIAGATITYNFLAGFDGLEAGQGILILSFLSYVSYVTGNSWLSIIGLSMVVALLGFWIFNKYPASVFPGDSLTWSVGALIASMAILGNFERIALIVFIPYIIEFCLKAGRGKLKKYSFGKPNPDGSLEIPYKKIYGLTHFAIFTLKKIKPSKKVYKKDVVLFIHLIQIIFIAIAWIWML
ncbi:MAG: hypothetical protein ACOCUU_01510 [Nanoarchaeota archaeon]